MIDANVQFDVIRVRCVLNSSHLQMLIFSVTNGFFLQAKCEVNCIKNNHFKSETRKSVISYFYRIYDWKCKTSATIMWISMVAEKINLCLSFSRIIMVSIILSVIYSHHWNFLILCQPFRYLSICWIIYLFNITSKQSLPTRDRPVWTL